MLYSLQNAWNIRQSSPYPCDNNTVTVSVTFNVPLFALCVPVITVGGLTGSLTTGTILPLTTQSVPVGSLLPDLAVNTWVKSTGTLTVTVTRANSVLGSTPATGDTALAFNIPLLNPASYQVSPLVSISASFSSGPVGNVLTTTTSVGLTNVSVLISTSYYGTPPISPLAPSNDYYLWTALSSVGPVSYPRPVGWAQFPLYVMPARLYTWVAQSSPFPCDANQITVALLSTVPLLPSCTPTITISGLAGTSTPDQSSLNITFLGGGIAGLFNLSGSTASGPWHSGSLTLQLVNLLSLYSAGSFVNVVDKLLFQISVNNSKVPDPSKNLCSQGLCAQQYIATTATSTLTLTSVVGASTSSDSGRPLYGTSNPFYYTYSAGAASFAVANSAFDLSKSSLALVAGDALPLNLRSIVLTATASQSSSYPCSANTLTVTFTPNSAPLLMTCTTQTNVTISGLIGSTTPSNTSLPVLSTPTIFGSSGSWDYSRSLLVLSSISTAIAGTTYSVSFVLVNGQASQAAQILSILPAPFTTAATTVSNVAGGGPLYVSALSWMVLTASQSTPWPCAPNTITVQLQPNVPLLSTCKSNAAAAAGRPIVTLAGFTGTVTPDNSSLPIGNPSSQSPLPTNGSWTKSSGTLVLVLAADTVASTLYTFTFSVTNRAQSQTAPTVSALTDRLTQPTTTTASYQGANGSTTWSASNPALSLTQEGQAMFIRFASFLLGTNISQSSNFPCDQFNTITVTTNINIPLFSSCNPSLTISGLTGSTTLTPFGLFSFSPSLFSNISFVSWNSASGTLQFSTSSLSSSSADGTLTGFGFRFVLSNQAYFQNAPTISLQLNLVDYLNFNNRFGLQQAGTNTQTSPMYILQPNVALHSSQSSPYPCDNNTLTFELYSQMPIFHACSPLISFTGLVGTVPDTSLNPSGSVYLSSDSSINLTTSAVWMSGTGSLYLNTTGNLGVSVIPTALFRIIVRNQAIQQSAPNFVFSMSYNTKGGTMPGAALYTPWTVSAGWVVSTSIVARSPYPVYSWPGDPSDWRQPLYIRTPVTTSYMGQSTPIPGISNTIGVTLSVNVELIPQCRPRIIFSNLQSACIVTAPEVSLQALSGFVGSYLSFSSAAKNSGNATWDPLRATLTLYTFRYSQNSSVPVPSSTVLANVSYGFSFGITNPIQGQDAPSISAQIVYTSNNFSAAVVSIQDLITVLPNVGIFPLVAGDAATLKVYAPIFLNRSIRQNNPMPGQLNTFTVTLATDIPLPENSVITISGFSTDPTADPFYFLRRDLAVSGSLLLSDPAGSGFISAVKDSAGPTGTGTVGSGYFDRVLGRLLLYVDSIGLQAGVVYSFSFQLRNPQCQMDHVNPCIQASRISAGCSAASITRTAMDTDAITTTGVSLINAPLGVDGINVPTAQAGEALPLRVRAPVITVAAVEQTSAFPCATNTLTFMLQTSVPLVGVLGQTIIIFGLRGVRNGIPVSMPILSSPNISVQSPSQIFGSVATWDPVNGVLVVPVVQDSEAGVPYTFSITIQNPSSPQACAVNVVANITGMCFSLTSVSWPLPTTANSALPGSGTCTNVIPPVGSTNPGASWGSATSLSNGRCPLMVSNGQLQLNLMRQSSYFPCDPSNTITVFILANIPLSLCNPSIAIYGLNGTLTPTSNVFAVSISTPNTFSNLYASWNGNGTLNMSSSLLSAYLPTSSCQLFVINFTVRNQKTARLIATLPQINIGSYPLSTLGGRQSMNRFSTFAPSLWQFDPLYVMSPQFVTKLMGQSSPWPGAMNTLTLTLSSNTPLWQDCTTIVVFNLLGACASIGQIVLSGPDANRFVGLFPSSGNWSTYSDPNGLEGKLTMGIVGSTAAYSAPCGSIPCNLAYTNYTISLVVSNPVVPQNSPAVMIQGDGSTGGVPISPVLVDKDLYSTPVLANGLCINFTSVCNFSQGDAAPLRIQAPSFFVSNIGQSTPYPGKMNTFTVTLLANIPLQAGSSITLSNLAGTATSSGSVGILGPLSSKFRISTGGSLVAGKGVWDLVANTLTLILGDSIAAGTEFVFGFQLQNPSCGQSSPPVCIRASDISPTNCTVCSQSKCIALPRSLMTRDFVTVYDTGVVNTLYPLVKYGPLATVTYGNSLQGDAYPLNIYSPSFVMKKIGQSTDFPAKMNSLTVTLATNVPLISGTQVTIFNLLGSGTISGSLALSSIGSAFSSCFASNGLWSQSNGSLIISVASDTVAGTKYTFSFVLLNPSCGQSPPLVSIMASPICLTPQVMCSDLSTPPSYLPGFYFPAPGDAQALLVKAPSFRVALVWQKNPYPGAGNVIHFLLATNVNIPANTNFTISGLTGSATNDNNTQPLLFPGSDNESLPFSTSDMSTIMSPTGSWSRNSGTLIATLRSESVANSTYRFAIQLRNPLCCQSAKTVSMSLSMTCFRGVNATWNPSGQLDPSVIESVGDGIETTPLYVRCPRWKLATITPTNAYPCTANTMVVSLQLNVPVSSTDGVIISLSGLVNSLSSNNASLQWSSNVFTFNFWSQSAGIIQGLWNSISSPAYQTVTLNFTLVNPSNFSAYIGRFVYVSANICSKDPASNILIHNLNTTVVQTQPVLSTVAPTFLVASITQQTSWPAAKNLITISLQATIPLFGSTFQCPISISVYGISGVCSLGADGSRVQLSGRDASIFSPAFWSQSQQSLILNLNGSLSSLRVFSFTLFNLVDAQSSPAFQLSVSGVVFAYTFTSFQKGGNLPSVTGLVGSSNGALFNPVLSDSEPLQILAPMFILKKVGQDTYWPAANNNIRITFSSNIDMQPGSVLIISSLDYLDGSSGALSGAINISGSAAMNFAASFSANVPPGQGMWDDSAKSLTLYVISRLTAGSNYSFVFSLQNPRCGQIASPVCIRARGISVSCSNYVVIPKRLLDADSGYYAPLSILNPVIIGATIVHSTPFASAVNYLTLTLQTNVPLGFGWFVPSVTLSGLTGSGTSASSLMVNNKLTGSWAQNSGTLVFVAPDSYQAANYSYNFSLYNGMCNQAAPVVSIQISGVCFAPRIVNPLSVVTCNAQATQPLQTIGGTCSGQTGLLAQFTQAQIGQSTPYPGCTNNITLCFTANVPLTRASSAGINIVFASNIAMDVVALNDNVLLSGQSANSFYGSTSVLSVVIGDGGSHCLCPSGMNSLIFTNAPNDTGSGASGSYTVVNGIVVSINVTSGGGGYLKPPLVSLNGSVCSRVPNLTAQMSYGGSLNAKGQWNLTAKVLTLHALYDLTACSSYCISFNVRNPISLAPGPFSSNVLQAALPVYISAFGIPISAVQMNYVNMWLSTSLPNVSTCNGDYQPMRIYSPQFILKKISQSNPFPGAMYNILSVSFSVNALLKAGSRIAITGISGAMGTVLSRTPIQLYSADGTMTPLVDNNFRSDIGNQLNSGTWYDCEKSLVLVFNTDSKCDGSVYSFSFVVSNPVSPQACANVQINATNIPLSTFYSAGPSTQINASLMSQDMTTVLTNIQGATKGDACAMKIWPAAFIVKDIGQSSPYPCAVNTITVTVASNVPMMSSMQYINDPGDAIFPYLFISRLSGVILGSTGTAPSIPVPGDVGPDVISSRNDSSKVIALVSSQFYSQSSNSWISDPSLFSSGVRIGNQQAVWIPSTTSSSESGIQIYIGNSTSQLYYRSGLPPQSGACFDSMTKFRLSFRVYNPSSPQMPSKSVSISSFGIPIPSSAMRQAIGDNLPMYVKSGAISAYIDQSSSNPCSINTISVTVSTSLTVWPRCLPNITITGLGNYVWPCNFNVSEVSTSYIGSVNSTVPGILTIALQRLQPWPATQTLSFNFQIQNPATTIPSPDPPIIQILNGSLLPSNISRNTTDQTRWPFTVQQATFLESQIWQSSPFPSQINTITVSLQSSVDLAAQCGVAITISNLVGACIAGSSVALNDVSAPTSASDRFSSSPSVQIIPGNSGSALWIAANQSLVLYVSNSVLKNRIYAFQFQLRNPSSPQTSPTVSIQASGIGIVPSAMTRVVGVPSVLSLFGASIVDSRPLEIIGLSVPWAFDGNASQSSVVPGMQNNITISFVTNIPLTSNPSTNIIISGFVGVQASDGLIPIYDSSNKVSTSFVGTWASSTMQLVLNVIGTDTLPGQVYAVMFSVVNPLVAQPSTPLTIESGGGVPIERSVLLSAGGNLAPLLVAAPQIYGASVMWNNSLHAYPGANNYIVFKFSVSCDLVPAKGKRLSAIISGLQGLVLSPGVVNITSSPPGIFTSCAALNVSVCLSNTAIWDSNAMALSLNVLAKITHDTPVVIFLQETNFLYAQNTPNIFIEISRNFAGYVIPPVLLSPDPSIQSDQQALFIHGSAGFIIKTISQSSSAPGSTNTITLVFQPQVPIAGDQESIITVSGILGSSTPDGTLKIYDTGSILFYSSAVWSSGSGTLLLRVWQGQTVPSDKSTTIKFDLTNPVYAQPSSDQILISASGGIPFAPSAMAGSSGGVMPMKVDALNFTVVSIAQSSAIPGGRNVITATFQASVLLTLSRFSVLTIEGLLGSDTVDSLAFPISVSSVAYTSSNSSVLFSTRTNSSAINVTNYSLPVTHVQNYSLPVFPFSPFDDVIVSLTDSCRWIDNQVSLNGVPSGVDVSGTTLYFTESNCQGRWTKIVSFNILTLCANLSSRINASGQVIWDDGATRCAALGKVESFQVLHGGNGYLAGTGTDNSTSFTVVSSAPLAAGLIGRCVVNSVGSVTNIIIIQQGTLYSSNVSVICPSACAPASLCSGAGSGSGLQVQANLLPVKAAISAGSWLRQSGSLVLRVRDQVKISFDNFKVCLVVVTNLSFSCSLTPSFQQLSLSAC